MWHQVRPAEREVLRDEIARYEAHRRGWFPQRQFQSLRSRYRELS